MDGIRQYLLSVVAAALLCTVVTNILGKKGMLSAAVKLIAGIFMAATIAAPLVKLQVDNLIDFTGDYLEDSRYITAQGQEMVRESLVQGIKAQTAAYILDKAESLGADLCVEVSVSEDELPVPNSVQISGNISPYGKSVLSAWMQNDLGIPVGEQIWTG